MQWLLLMVRLVLRAVFGDEGNGVALAARIDGRIEQHRRGPHLGEGWGWSLLPFGGRNRSGRKSPVRVRGRLGTGRRPGVEGRCEGGC